MTYIKINDTQYPAEINGILSDRAWGNRATKSITLEMDFDSAKELFVDGVIWSIVYQPESWVDGVSGETIIPGVEEYDNSDYYLAGPITDNRDGTLTIKMGKPTAEEMLAKLEVTYDEQ